MWLFRKLLALILFLPTLIHGATGDVTMAINADGYSVDVTVEGKTSGGTHNTGFLTTNALINGDETAYITYSRAGFDSTGATTTYTITNYITYPIRKPYPNEAGWDETDAGGDVTIRYALQKYVYSTDSSVTAQVSAGLYNQAGDNNAAADLVVTNNSSQTADGIHKTLAWFTWPGFNIETGSTMEL